MSQLTAATLPAQPQASSPLTLISGWILSTDVLAMRFFTNFGLNLDPASGILAQLQLLDLPDIVKNTQCPSYYGVVIEFLEMLAKSLDAKKFTRKPGLHTLFFPDLENFEPTKTNQENHQKTLLELRLLDHLLCIFFPTIRVPHAALVQDIPAPGEVTAFPKGATLYKHAEWIADKLWCDGAHIGTLLDALSLKDDVNASTTYESQDASVEAHLTSLIMLHQTQVAIHSYNELIAILAKGIWLSIKNFHKPDFNRSTAAMLQMEELIWPGVFDLIQQCCDRVAGTPAPRWHEYHARLLDWAPANMPMWQWVKRQTFMQPVSPPTTINPWLLLTNYPSTPLHGTEAETLELVDLPVLPENATSGQESSHSATQHQAGDQQMKDIDDVAPGNDMIELVTEKGKQKEDQSISEATGRTLRKKQPATDEVPSEDGSSKKAKESKGDNSSGLDKKKPKSKTPLFKQLQNQSVLTRPEEVELCSTVQRFNTTKKTTHALSFKLLTLCLQDGEIEKRWKPLELKIPQVKEQQHDWEFFEDSLDLAVAQQGNLPETCNTVLHVSHEQQDELDQNEFSMLFKEHNLLIEASPAYPPGGPGHFKTKTGDLTLDKVIDPACFIEVHVEEDEQQKVSKQCSLGGVFNHMNSSTG
ncbi:hypothetical protein FRC09_010743 [Ceratobasidium sp. 395]|nr:hypothetical protein FRC09_010743 [Ceratobasidium sp. 395]